MRNVVHFLFLSQSARNVSHRLLTFLTVPGRADGDAPAPGPVCLVRVLRTLQKPIDFSCCHFCLDGGRCGKPEQTFVCFTAPRRK